MALLRLSNVLVYILTLMGMIRVSESVSSDIRRLKSKVDFVLDTVIEVKESLQDLRAEVSRMQKDTKISGSDTSLNRPGSGTLVENNVTGLALAMKPLVKDFETKMIRVLKGFQEEKSSTKQMLKEQGQRWNKQMQSSFERVTDSITAVLSEWNETNIHRYNEMTLAIADINRTVYESFSDIETGYDDLSDQFIKYKDTVVEADVDKLQNNVQYIIDYVHMLPYKILRHVQLRDNIRQYRNSVYTFHSQSLTWAEAQEKCRKEHGHLAEISDNAENEVVKNVSKGQAVWLGGTDAEQEGHWHWVKSGLDIPDIFWAPGEPNDAGNNEDCLHNPPSYNDIRCTEKFPFVCEVELAFVP